MLKGVGFKCNNSSCSTFWLNNSRSNGNSNRGKYIRCVSVKSIGCGSSSSSSSSSSRSSISSSSNGFYSNSISIRVRVISKHFSTNGYQSKENKVTKNLLRQFLIQIHPDFFVQFKNEQEINNRNYGNLQEICGSYDNYQGDIKQKARTLVFYLKPTDVDPTPRRVKISIGSLYKIEISIVEILETLGIETSYSRATDDKGGRIYPYSISKDHLLV
jgi:hypothetical protein